MVSLFTWHRIIAALRPAHAHAVSQLVLDLGPPPPPTFDAFVVGDNREALDAVRGLADPGRGAGARFLYLWGPASSGRSHLLRSLEGAVKKACGDEQRFSTAAKDWGGCVVGEGKVVSGQNPASSTGTALAALAALGAGEAAEAEGEKKDACC